MSATMEEIRSVGRKKRNIPARVIKIDGDLVSKAELLGRNQGMTTGEYVASVLRPIITREWDKLLKSINEKGG